MRAPASSKASVAVIRQEGSNGDREMAAALHAAGLAPWDVAMTDLVSGRITLERGSHSWPAGAQTCTRLAALCSRSRNILERPPAVLAVEPVVRHGEGLLTRPASARLEGGKILGHACRRCATARLLTESRCCRTCALTVQSNPRWLTRRERAQLPFISVSTCVPTLSALRPSGMVPMAVSYQCLRRPKQSTESYSTARKSRCGSKASVAVAVYF